MWIDRDAHDEHADKGVEQDAQLDQQRRPDDGDHAEDEDAVFQHQVADHLHQRVAPADDQEQADRRSGRSPSRASQKAPGAAPASSRRRARPTAPARRSRTGPTSTKPTNGSTSRLSIGARPQPQQQPGKDDALQRDIAGRQQPARQPSPPSCAISGTRPNKTPCNDSQRMQAPIRLVPSRAKQVSSPSA